MLEALSGDLTPNGIFTNLYRSKGIVIAVLEMLVTRGFGGMHWLGQS